MNLKLVITGTDTGIGKTVFSAALTDALGACYWKPIQSGLDEETDSETVLRLGRIPFQRILPKPGGSRRRYHRTYQQKSTR